MQKFQLPFVILPSEFTELLKTNLSVSSSPAPVFDLLRPNFALYGVLEKAFQEFDDGRGFEKTMLALGWPNFRDRMASIFIYKTVHGHYPIRTDMELVEEIKRIEATFASFGPQSNSRVFLLGLYLKLANLKLQRTENNKFLELKIPEETAAFLRMSQGRSERPDWLILITMHLIAGLGDKMLMNALMQGKKFDELYELLPEQFRRDMHQNLMAYGASIKEPDIFLYDKV